MLRGPASRAGVDLDAGGGVDDRSARWRGRVPQPDGAPLPRLLSAAPAGAAAAGTLGDEAAAGALVEDTLRRRSPRSSSAPACAGWSWRAVRPRARWWSALGVAALRIGPEIDPGVPWTWSERDGEPALALKSGNFGAPDFFVKALVPPGRG